MARLQACEAIGRYTVHDVPIERFSAVWVLPREVEQVNAREDDEEAGEEGNGVHGVGGVEAAEEDEGGAEGGGREGDVVEGVNAMALC